MTVLKCPKDKILKHLTDQEYQRERAMQNPILCPICETPMDPIQLVVQVVER